MRSQIIKPLPLPLLIILVLAACVIQGNATSLEYVSSTLWTGVNDAVARDSVVLAAFQYGLQVIDMTDPAAPRLIAQLHLPPGGFVSIDLLGNLVFLAGSSAGVAIVDISNLSNPALVAWQDTPGAAVAVLARGNYLYVADSWEGLQIVNLTDPAHPFLEGGYDTPGDARDIALFGNYVLVADGYDGGVQVINVEFPQIPYPAGNFNTDRTAKGIAVEGHHAYVADADGGLVILDISDPTSPFRTSVYPQSTTWRYAEDVAVKNGVVYFTAGFLHIIDATDPENPVLVDTMHEAGYCLRVRVSDSGLLTTYPTVGITLLSIQSGTQPVLDGNYPVPGDLDRIAVHDNILIVGEDPGGVHLLDILDPRTPDKLSFIPSLAKCYGVAVSGDYLYVADADSGTGVFDLTDPQTPAEHGRILSGISDWEVTSDSAFLCVSAYNTGTTFYRLDDPVRPSKIGTFLASYLARAACDGNYGYIAAGLAGFQIVNLTDSAFPFRTGLLQISGAFNDLALSGDRAYLAHQSVGLLITDISNPANPRELGRYGQFSAASSHASGIAYDRGLAFLAVETGGVWVLDVSNPAQPVPVAAYNTLGSALRVAVSQDNVYVADHYGVTILKLTRPTDIGDDHPSITPGEFELDQNYPNPFNPQTTIEFALPRKTHVTLSIYNALGQEVANLVDKMLAAGTHRVVWDGTNAHGRTVSSGVYFYRVTTPDGTGSRKMLLLK